MAHKTFHELDPVHLYSLFSCSQPSATGMFLELSLLAYAELFALISMYHVLSYPWASVQTDLPIWESLPPATHLDKILSLLRAHSDVKCINS